MPPKPPTSEPVAEPSSEDIPVSYREYAGLRGCSGQTHILQSDGSTNPGIAIQATGNIYLDASARMQQSSQVCVQSIGDRLLQYICDIEKHVSGQLYEHVQGPSTFKVNTDHTVEVVGNHTLNVATAQETAIGATQNIKVSGARTIECAGLTQTVNGQKLENVIGPKTVFTNATETTTVLGGCVSCKASSEQSLTFSEKINIGMALEASLTLGASEKVQIGAHAEQNFAKKHTLTVASCTDLNFGPRKSNSLPANEIAGGLTKVNGEMGSTFKARLAQFKYTLVGIKGKMITFA